MVSLQKWDSSLKLMAEAYAAKCIWSHNPELEETGENLYAGTGPLDLAHAVEKWFMEHLDYDFHNNTCDEDKMCGHYTQMVWADTHRVGCAFHLCDKMDRLDWEDRTSFLVCNYFPAGNYEGVRPYVEGDWCSRCPENLQKCENNLCVADSVDEDVVGDDNGTETAFVPEYVGGDDHHGTETGFVPEDVGGDDHGTETGFVPEDVGGDDHGTETGFVPEDVGGDDHGTETSFVPTFPEELGVAETAQTTLVQTEPAEEEPTPTPGPRAARVHPQDVFSSAAEEEEEEEEEEKEAQREESVVRKEEVRENLQTMAPVGSGPGSGPSVLFLCLTAVLSLRM